jgi:import inner membrane translocase subunit TIM10
MKLSMENIYRVCTKKCVTDFKNSIDLSDREKICISRCFEKKNETMNLTME